ncbi:pentatricopeptide repeat-containing protein At2g38420, mitochondrial [Malania oleifera]|uniref:pentatricopeptide repeat-containing protein At2g38420, mitochondrial n=1 Tax=Malania oleifera TaxID=397392 RepID=UPI0025AE0843|nr:pentatricopeptide repeat-containing protein At2g38420, mitochondrial [Malania oleifera]
MAFLSSSSKTGHSYLRKRRKWPLSPYKAKWHQIFSQQQAMYALKKAARSPQQNEEDGDDDYGNSGKPNLLSTLADSFSIYNCDPTPSAYHFVIKTLTKTSQFHQLPQILDRLEFVEKFETPERIFIDLIEIYGDAGRIQEAFDLFFRIPSFRCVPSVHSLNALLSILSGNGEFRGLVPHILLKSRLMNIRIEESTFRILIATLCRIRRHSFAIQLLGYMLSYGYSLDVRICSLILSSLCQLKDLSSAEAMRFLDQARAIGFIPGRVDYCNVIRSLVKKGRGTDASDVLNQMKIDGMKPDIVCYTMVLSGIIGEGEHLKAEELFDEILVLGLVPDIYTYNVFINGLCKQNNVQAAFKMLGSMEELGCKPNLITYNMLLEALCEVGELSWARNLVREMGLKGVRKNSHTYRILVGGLVSKGEIFEACAFLEEMLDKCWVPKSSMVDDIICGLCENHLACKAIDLLETVVGRNAVPGARAWESLLVDSTFQLASAETLLTNLINSMQTLPITLAEH